MTFPSAEPGPARDTRRARTRASLAIGSVIVVVIVGVVTALIVHASLKEASGGSAEDRVKTLVEQVNQRVEFPMEIDSITTWTGMEAEGGAAHYDYTIAANVDPSTITTDLVRSSILPSVCASSDTADALDAGIDLKYTYTFEGTDKTLQFTVTKADCA